MDELVISTKNTRSRILENLVAACNWAGISRGRAIEYQTLFDEFFRIERKSRDHILAYNELAELVEIYELWQDGIDIFPGLKNKIHDAFSSGPTLREDELSRNSGNRPRNDAFTILLAGKLKKAGIMVVTIDGIPANSGHPFSDRDLSEFLKSDVTMWSKSLFRVECKRPQSKEAIGIRAKEARKQLNGQDGIIAIDCSAALRPPEKVLEAPSDHKAAEFLDKLLVAEAKPMIEEQFKPYVAGAIMYMRTPVHTIHKISPILDMNGNPITTYNQVAAATVLFMANANSPNRMVFRAIKDSYMGRMSVNAEAQSA